MLANKVKHRLEIYRRALKFGDFAPVEMFNHSVHILDSDQNLDRL